MIVLRMRGDRARAALIFTACSFAVGLVLASCTFTGPLDGYYEGERPDASVDSGCPKGFADCDNDPKNGCEVDLNTASAHCGSCVKTCIKDNTTSYCAAGKCVVTACSNNREDCDKDPDNGCEADLQTNPNHCGTCPKACTTQNGEPACKAGKCDISTCSSPFLNCDKDITNGCETNSDTSIVHCGVCDDPCEVRPNADPNCVDGFCKPKCKGNYGDCDTTEANGCEVDLNADALNCKTCGNKCPSKNGTASCVSGECLIACSAGFKDCNAKVVDGCEVDILTDPSNCNGCSLPCSAAPFAQPTCTGGSCGYACNPGRGDCDGDPGNGCEADTTTASQHCGGCNHACIDSVCVNGACLTTTLVDKQAAPVAIVLDSSSIYWTDASDGTLMKMPQAGGSSTQLSDLSAVGPLAIDPAGANLYWATGINISKIKSSGGFGSTFVVGENVVSAIAADASHVYWLRDSPTNGELVRSSVSAAAASALVSGQSHPSSLAVDNASAFWTNRGVATTAPFDGSVMKSAKGSTVATSLASQQPGACALAIDPTYVYWLNCLDGSVYQVSKAGGTPTRLAVTSPIVSGLISDTPGIATDGVYVYIAIPGSGPQTADGTILRIAIDGGKVNTLASKQNHPWRVALSSSHVFWANVGTDVTPVLGDGSIMKVAK